MPGANFDSISCWSSPPWSDARVRRSVWLTTLRWCCRWKVYAHPEAGTVERPVLVLQVLSSDHCFGGCKRQRTLHIRDAGGAGSLGDAFTFNHSRLNANIDNGKWLVGETQVVNRKILKPYIVGDSAFPLYPSLMKAFPHPVPPGRRKRLNAAVCRAPKFVEQSFSDTKGRFKILSRASFNDPNYAAKVADVCFALHNVCMYANDCNKLRYVPDPDLYVAGCGPMFGPIYISTALDIQSALSTIAYLLNPRLCFSTTSK